GRIKVQVIRASLMGAEKTLENVVEMLEPGFLDIYRPFRIVGMLEPGEYKVEYTDTRKKAFKPLYSQGDVVKLMKERGIGRPSTYAKILQTLLKRRYVVERGKLGKLIPTLLGREVYSYLSEKSGDRIAKLVSEERTAMLERLMDLVESGEKKYLEVLADLYEEVHPIYLELRSEVGEAWQSIG
ncbi:MAG: DNA topoisomerase, partial [Candidatus Korarchaeota archaeon]|nr:DNA topoisomerase [Candidatus Korarchaeota archaeon]